MGRLVEIVTPLHTATSRDYLQRMNDNKVQAMIVAKDFEADYWDGDRRFGYGGYQYMPGRWQPVARSLIERYELTNASSVLDIGCGKGFLLYEIQRLLPDARLVGVDLSEHALKNQHENFHGSLLKRRAQDELPFEIDEFDLTISLATLHNLRIFDLVYALSEMERVSKSSYLMVESYRDEAELFNLQCWALTAQTFLDPEEWTWLFDLSTYMGDYEFIYFQ